MASNDAPFPRKQKKEPSAAEILQRQPPFDVEAEMGVLGSILLLPEVCDEIPSLRSEDFYDDANRKIYENLREMHDSGEKIDITLLVSRLRTAGDYEKVGGAAYLARLSSSVPNAAHAVYYCSIVTEKAVYRRLIQSSTEVLRDAYDQSSSAKELCAQAEQKVFAIMDGRSSQSVQNIADVLHQSMDRMEARMRDEYVDGAAETGLTKFDEMTGGLHHGELIILAARPSMGKTALAMNIGEHVSINQKQPVLFVSLEMSGIELADRMLCSLARVNGHRVRNGTISSDDRDKLIQTANEISQAPLFVDDSPSRTVSEIAAAARRIKRREEARNPSEHKRASATSRPRLRSWPPPCLASEARETEYEMRRLPSVRSVMDATRRGTDFIAAPPYLTTTVCPAKRCKYGNASDSTLTRV